MKDAHRPAIEALMRSGYMARGFVYLVIGALAVFAALNGGEAEGSTGAFAYLASQPLGKVVLATVAGGLFAYTLWRVTEAILDIEDEGDDASGIAARAGQFISGATHAALGVSALLVVFGRGGGDDGTNGTEQAAATALAQPFGQGIVLAAGGATLAVAVYLFLKARGGKWKQQIRNTATTERLSPLIRFGLYAHAAVLVLIGVLIVWAGYTANAENAAGLKEALAIVETQPFGRTLLGLAGAGMIGFAAYCAIQSLYRIAPGANDRPLAATA